MSCLPQRSGGGWTAVRPALGIAKVEERTSVGAGSERATRTRQPMPRIFPPLPEIGHPETYYAKQVHRADKRGDQHAHEAYKVGQYITLGLNPYLPWPDKLKYFRHALARHCNPPPYPDDEV